MKDKPVLTNKDHKDMDAFGGGLWWSQSSGLTSRRLSQGLHTLWPLSIWITMPRREPGLNRAESLSERDEVGRTPAHLPNPRYVGFRKWTDTEEKRHDICCKSNFNAGFLVQIMLSYLQVIWKTAKDLLEKFPQHPVDKSGNRTPYDPNMPDSIVWFKCYDHIITLISIKRDESKNNRTFWISIVATLASLASAIAQLSARKLIEEMAWLWQSRVCRANRSRSRQPWHKRGAWLHGQGDVLGCTVFAKPSSSSAILGW